MRAIVAKDVMTPDLLTVSKDMTVSDLAEFLTRYEISGSPVVDGDGRICGVVSAVDIAAAAADQAELADSDAESDFYVRGWKRQFEPLDAQDLHLDNKSLLVSDIMTPTVYSVAEDATISEVAEMMIHAHIHRLLVLREDEFVGIISTSDLLGLLIDDR